jgi:hypothetical protein
MTTILTRSSGTCSEFLFNALKTKLVISVGLPPSVMCAWCLPILTNLLYYAWPTSAWWALAGEGIPINCWKVVWWKSRNRGPIIFQFLWSALRRTRKATTRNRRIKSLQGFVRDPDNTSSVQRQLNEQSIQVCIDGLEDGDARAIYKNVAMDFFNYGRVKMFVHANSEDTDDDELTVYSCVWERTMIRTITKLKYH